MIKRLNDFIDRAVTAVGLDFSNEKNVDEGYNESIDGEPGYDCRDREPPRELPAPTPLEQDVVVRFIVGFLIVAGLIMVFA